MVGWDDPPLWRRMKSCITLLGFDSGVSIAWMTVKLGPVSIHIGESKCEGVRLIIRATTCLKKGPHCISHQRHPQPELYI